MIEHAFCQWQRRRDAFNDKFTQTATHALNGFVASWFMDDQFPNHGIVVRTDRVTFVNMRIESNAWPTRKTQLSDHPRAATKIVLRIFRVDSQLDRAPGVTNVGLRKRQFFSRSNQNLLLDQIDACDKFRHRMFHLNSGINFDEVEVVILVNNEFTGAGICVSGFSYQIDGTIAHALADFFRQLRSRAFFDQLLVTSLH